LTGALADAIAAYHDLLTDEVAAESAAMLERELTRRGLFFGERALCTVLRPRFLLPAQYRDLQSRAAALLAAFARAYDAGISDARVRRQFRLADWEESLIDVDPGFRDPSPTSRFDLFYLPESGEARLTEYNGETPAGAGYGDALAEIFLDLPAMHRFVREYDVRTLPTQHSVLRVLLDAYRQWGGVEPPRIAILDWRDVPTASEFALFEAYFRTRGFDCAIVDPRDVEFRGGELRHPGGRITLIYKRVLISELIERGGLDHPVVQAVRAGAACMVNPFRCKLLHKKASLAVLSDERNETWFSQTEAEAIAAHVPWTRVVEERKTRYAGRPVDLISFMQQNRERLVLKPNDEYGGKGIVLGWRTSDEEWERAIAGALEEPFIVQERITIPSEPYPSRAGGRTEIADRILDTAPFAWSGGFMDGCLTRLSTETLVNVTAGGGSQVPTFVIEKRSAA
jgi:hypothetical protein